MGLVTVFCPFTSTGAGRLVVQIADEPRFVVDWSLNPVALVGQLSRTFPPAGVMVSCGGVTGNKILNMVPEAEVPPRNAVPYKVLLERNNPACGLAPSLPPLKLYTLVNV
jgi:hypothetical protein